MEGREIAWGALGSLIYFMQMPESDQSSKGYSMIRKLAKPKAQTPRKSHKKTRITDAKRNGKAKPIHPAVALLDEWLKDESGYDEETWPALKKALDEERDRVGARRLFDG